MTFLAPALLVASLAAVVPILLHLLQRSQGKPLTFPALRYLRRTTREHARSIRSRQRLLLILRVCALLLLALAAARPLLSFWTGDHPPTAVALVVDNTASSSAVAGSVRVLDRLLAPARASLEAANPGDRFWIVPAGEPWKAVRPLTPEEALAQVEQLRPQATAGSLWAAVRRGRELVTSSDLPASEVQVLSDLQASALERGHTTEAVNEPLIPVVVLVDSTLPRKNRWIESVSLGGGIPPLPGDRGAFAVRVGATAPEAGPVPVRMLTGNRLRAREEAAPGEGTVLYAGPFPQGWVEGRVETDPDALRWDDTRYFAFLVRPPVEVDSPRPGGVYLDEALGVLEGAGRIRTQAARPEVTILRGGTGGVAAIAPAVILFPPEDPNLLPGLNRLLESWGSEWRLEIDAEPGAVEIQDPGIPGLGGIAVTRRFLLRSSRTEGAARPGGTEVGETEPAVLARTTDGRAWLVEEELDGRRLLLSGSPLDPEWTDLPLKAGMVPFLDWSLTAWAIAGTMGLEGVRSGDMVRIPGRVETLRTPDDRRVAVSPGESVRLIDGPGIYRFLAGDSVVGALAVNLAPEESDLSMAPEPRIRDLAGERGVLVADPGEWSRVVFRARTGPPVGALFLLLALAVLVAESLVAAGHASGPAGERSPRRVGTVPFAEGEP